MSPSQPIKRAAAAEACICWTGSSMQRSAQSPRMSLIAQALADRQRMAGACRSSFRIRSVSPTLSSRETSTCPAMQAAARFTRISAAPRTFHLCRTASWAITPVSPPSCPAAAPVRMATTSAPAPRPSMPRCGESIARSRHTTNSHSAASCSTTARTPSQQPRAINAGMRVFTTAGPTSVQWKWISWASPMRTPPASARSVRHWSLRRESGTGPWYSTRCSSACPAQSRRARMVNSSSLPMWSSPGRRPPPRGSVYPEKMQIASSALRLLGPQRSSFGISTSSMAAPRATLREIASAQELPLPDSQTSR